MKWYEVVEIIANIATCITSCTLICAVINYFRNLPRKRKFPLKVEIKKRQLANGNNFFTMDIDLKIINKTNRRDYIYSCEFVFNNKTYPIYLLINNQRNTINRLENIKIEPNQPLILNGFLRVDYNFEIPEEYSIIVKLQNKTFVYEFSNN